jgi:hypothetical protein
MDRSKEETVQLQSQVAAAAGAAPVTAGSG